MLNTTESDHKQPDSPVVNDLSDILPQTKFEINYKDKEQLIKDLHYVANHLFPLTDAEYDANHDVSKSSYTLKVIQGGITNLLYLMTPNVETEESKKLLLRVYGENTEVLIDREREEKLFYEVGSLGFGPKLYGIFGNGRLEQWYDNAHTVPLHERKHCKKIAARLAEMHSLQPVLLQKEASTPLLWKTIDKWFGIASAVEFKDDHEKQTRYEQLNWPNIAKQIEIMRSILPSARNENDMDKLCAYLVQQQSDEQLKQMTQKQFNDKVYKIAFNFMCENVFSHNDLLGGNVLHLEDTQEIKFVDFEYGSYNYRAFDFANHFCEYAGFDCDWKKHFPDKKHMKQFVHDYLAFLCGHHQYKHGVNENVTDLFCRRNAFTEKDYDSFLEACCDIVTVFTAIDHYFWGLWGVVQSKHSPIDFDFTQYAHDRLVSGYNFALTLLPPYWKISSTGKSKI